LTGGTGDVVDVVSRGSCERPVLTPAGHAGENEAGVAVSALLRAEAKALSHARPEALDQHISLVGEPQQQVDCGRVLQIQPDGAPPAA
jgi:hypothetical protein